MIHIYSITIAIPIYNRLKYVELFGRSLQQCDLLSNCNVKVYDDASTEFDASKLRDLFPYAKEVVRRKKRLNADGNMYRIYKDFLTSTDDILVMLDSDLLCDPNFIKFILNNIDNTDGVLSLYNSILHPPFKVIDDVFVHKLHVGGAGVVFKRNVVRSIVNNVPYYHGCAYDWLWSKYLTENNIRIFCSKDSMVQHIGFEGQNCNSVTTVDIGLGFNPVTHHNFATMYQVYTDLFHG